MKVVLDTNVLVAAFVARGLCEAVYETCLVHHELVLPEHIMAELARHLPRVLRIDEDHAARIIAAVRAEAIIVEPATPTDVICRDADDQPILGTVVAGEADCIVTGDQDLLDLGSYHGKPILSPRMFHDLIS